MPQIVQLQSFHNKNGHLTEFAGFTLPLWFTGITPETLAVRNAVGIFDVSHMGRALVTGDDSERFLNRLASNDVSALTDGLGQYSLLCNPDGTIKDDVLVLRLQKDKHLIVYNAANRAKDYEWFKANTGGFKVSLQDMSNETALFAVQGPKAVHLISEVVERLRPSDLPRFGCAEGDIAGSRVLLSRTGYTGEDGFEILVWNSPVQDASHALAVWDKLLEAGKPFDLHLCGLGARDLLRLEAGLCLYGTDIDEKTNPFEARLGFVVKLEKDFVGRGKLQEAKQKGPKRLRVGLMMQNRVIPRHGFGITSHGLAIGAVTSGTLSPTVDAGIAMGYVEQASAKEGTLVDVHIRERYETARVTRTPFYDPTKYGYSRSSP